MPEVNSGTLGSQDGYLYELRSGGRASLDGDLAAAMEIVDGAQNTLLMGRADAGAFERYVVDSTQATLDDIAVRLSEALSQQLDTDMAFETPNPFGPKSWQTPPSWQSSSPTLLDRTLRIC